MKKHIIALFLLLTAITGYSQSWIGINKTAPAYSYSLPAAPIIMDTMNIRLAYLQVDSTAAFQVIEFKNTPLDSSNTAFETALTSTSGDTLLALAQTIVATNGATITNSQTITTFDSYKGLETSMQYDDPLSGKTILIYTRFFYNAHTLIAFTLKGTQDHYTELASEKSQFFSSINMNTLN